MFQPAVTSSALFANLPLPAGVPPFGLANRRVFRVLIVRTCRADAFESEAADDLSPNADPDHWLICHSAQSPTSTVAIAFYAMYHRPHDLKTDDWRRQAAASMSARRVSPPHQGAASNHNENPRGRDNLRPKGHTGRLHVDVSLIHDRPALGTVRARAARSHGSTSNGCADHGREPGGLRSDGPGNANRHLGSTSNRREAEWPRRRGRARPRRCSNSAVRRGAA